MSSTSKVVFLSHHLKYRYAASEEEKQASNMKTSAQKILSQGSFKTQILQQYLKGHVCSLGIHPAHELKRP